MRIAAGATLLVLAALMSVSSAFKEANLKDKDMKEFRCQVCQVFSREYSDRINDKATDEHPDVLNEFARGNASLYLWDEDHKRLLPRETKRGGQLIDTINQFVETDLLTHYASEIVLHAVHSAAHRRNPARVNWAFVWQVLCVEHHQFCDADEKLHHDRSFEVLRHDFETFKSHYEEPHADVYNELKGRHHFDHYDDHHVGDHPEDFHGDIPHGESEGGAMEIPEEDPGMHAWEREAMERMNGENADDYDL